MGFTRLPWWSAFPMSVGMGVMGVFAPSVLPDWWQKVFFFLGAAFFVLGVVAALLHFGVGGWFQRHVFWRFRIHPPALAAAGSQHPLAAPEVAPQAEKGGYWRPLTDAERQHLSAVVIAVYNYVKGDVGAYVDTIRPLQEWRSIMSADGPQVLLRMVEEAWRGAQPFSAEVDNFRRIHHADLSVAGLENVLGDIQGAIGGRLPDAFRHMSAGLQPLPDDYRNPSPVDLPGQQMVDAIGLVSNLAGNAIATLTNWRIDNCGGAVG